MNEWVNRDIQILMDIMFILILQIGLRGTCRGHCGRQLDFPRPFHILGSLRNNARSETFKQLKSYLNNNNLLFLDKFEVFCQY